jgi:hypothetical protein
MAVLRPMDTGSTPDDARADYARARRRRLFSRLARLVRTGPSDIDVILPFDEVVEALGRTGERYVGVQAIDLDSVVGSVGRTTDFDRRFRPTSPVGRERWERMAAAIRSGKEMPPISVYRIGAVHFVRDGHHRVSVQLALGRTAIDAEVTEVRTKVDACDCLSVADLPLKAHERVFFERVPLAPAARPRIVVSDASRYGQLADTIEAWGYRRERQRDERLSREELAATWLAEEYDPVVATLGELGLCQTHPQADAYLCVATERYRLLHTTDWTERTWDALARELS